MSTPAPELGPPSDRTKLRRKPDRGRYDATTIHAILDDGLVAHVGFASNTGLGVLPMVYGRVGDQLYLHGAAGNHMLGVLADADVCVTVTLVDALVLSRSAFHHSMNYRSVVVYGRAVIVDDLDEKDRAMRAVVDHMLEGRSSRCRPPSVNELRATRVVRVSIAESSAKIRTGPPIEEPDDLALGWWGGEIPIVTTRGTPVPDQYVTTEAM